MDQVLALLNSLKINSSIFVMLGIFIGAYWLCYLLFLKKLTGYLIERDKRTEGRSDSVDSMNEELHALSEELREKKTDVSKEAEKLYSEIKNTALSEQSETVKTAKEKAAQEIATARAEVERELSAETDKIRKEVPQLAQAVVEQLLTKSNSNSGSSTSVRPGV